MHVQLGLAIVASILSAPFAMAGDKENGLGFVTGQPPIFNGPTTGEYDALGVAGGCVECPAEGIEPSVDLGSQAVILQSGREIRTEEDLRIPGVDRGVDFCIRRRHTTRYDDPYSPFGKAWSFNYRHIFKLSGTALQFEGYGRVDDFIPVPGKPDQWDGTLGRLDRAIWNPEASEMTVRRPDGTTLIFRGELQSNGEIHGHLIEGRSPNGNSILVNFSAADASRPILDRRIDNLVDSFGRTTFLLYTNGQYQDQVTFIADFSGRLWTYIYDNDGDLISVTGPPVNHPEVVAAGNAFPNGKTKSYAYRKLYGTSLEHALTSITFPFETVHGGAPRLTWAYDENPGLTFGFVIAHGVGDGTSAGGTFHFTYTGLPVFGTPDINTPVSSVIVNDRNGTDVTVVMNFLGQMLSETVSQAATPRQEPPLASLTRQFTYSPDGLVLSETKPLGNRIEYAYAGAGFPRLSAANRTKKTYVPDGRQSDQTSIVFQNSYDPIYNKVYQATDPRGFVTTHHLDYMEDLSNSVATLAPGMGLTVAELNAVLSLAGIPNLGMDVNGDAVVDQYCGNVIEVVHPTTTIPAEGAQLSAPIASPQMASEHFWFNSRGQRTRHIDCEENVHEWVYFDASDPEGDGSSPMVGDGGFLMEYREDTTASSGRNSGTNSVPVNKVTQFSYVGVNGFPTNVRGAPVVIRDPRGIETHRLVNSLDQVIKEVRAAVVPTGLTAFAYETITRYDENDRLFQTDVEDVGNPSGVAPGGFIRTTKSFDLLDDVVQVIEDDGGLGITTIYEYDGNQNRTAEVLGFGTAEASRTEWLYDERNLLYATTRGKGSVDSVMANKIDANGNVIEEIDAESQGGAATTTSFLAGDRKLTSYDGFDRPRVTVDREGLVTTRTYDPSSHVISELQEGDGVFLPFTRLAQTDFAYDERDRLWKTEKHLFHYAGLSKGSIDPGAADPPGGADLVVAVHIFDRMGREAGLVDADADVCETWWDGAGRKLIKTDPMGNQVGVQFDANDNILLTIERESAANSALVATDEFFVNGAAYDALNRRVVYTEENLQQTFFEYDSRDNIVVTRDAMGNEVETYHDPLDRMVEVKTYLSANGQNATRSSHNALISRKQAWDALNRVKSQNDDSQNVTLYGWDPLSRGTRIDYGDGTFESWTYNLDSEIQTRVNQTGYTWTLAHDREGRMTSASVANTPGLAPGDPNYLSYDLVANTQLCCFYDDLGRLWLHCDFNGPGSADDVVTQYFVDSLGRRIYQAQSIPVSGFTDVIHEYQGENRQVADTYPSGRRVHRSFDSLDRLSEVREGNANGALIAAKEYIGAHRDLKVEYGNGATLVKADPSTQQTTSGALAGYDINRRSTLHRWTANSQELTAYRNAYNARNLRVEETREHVNRTDDYTHDSSYRLTGFRRDSSAPGALDGVLSSRTVNGADKMLSFSDEGSAKSPVVDGDPAEAGLNQYSSFEGDTRVYNQNGSLAQTGSGADLRRYVYDASNRLVSVHDSNGAILALYVYDGENRRVLRAVANPSIQFVRYTYRGWQVLEERDASGNSLREYVDGSGLDEHFQMRDIADGTDFYYHSNSQGFVGGLSDANGNLVVSYEYSWLGRARITGSGSTGPAGENPYQWQGRRFDPETGWYQFRQRYYDPAVGEFVTIDPTGLWRHAQGNGYSSFGMNEWNTLDPRGEGWSWLTAACGAVVGAVGGLCFEMANQAVEVLVKGNDFDLAAVGRSTGAGAVGGAVVGGLAGAAAGDPSFAATMALAAGAADAGFATGAAYGLMGNW